MINNIFYFASMMREKNDNTPFSTKTEYCHFCVYVRLYACVCATWGGQQKIKSWTKEPLRKETTTEHTEVQQTFWPKESSVCPMGIYPGASQSTKFHELQRGWRQLREKREKRYSRLTFQPNCDRESKQTQDWRNLKMQAEEVWCMFPIENRRSQAAILFNKHTTLR